MYPGIPSEMLCAGGEVLSAFLTMIGAFMWALFSARA